MYCILGCQRAPYRRPGFHLQIFRIEIFATSMQAEKKYKITRISERGVNEIIIVLPDFLDPSHAACSGKQCNALFIEKLHVPIENVLFR